MNPAKHFHVHLGAPEFVDHLPDGPTLVIDPDQASLDRLQQQTLHGRALHDLIETADLPLEEHQTGCLVVRQGDPTAALASAGDWMERLQIIELRSPAAALNWASVLRGQLEPLGFRPSDRDMLWQRPGVLMLRFLLERLQTQREQLVLERDEQMQGRQVMAQQLQDVLLERDELKKHLADVQVQMTETHRDELEQLQNRWDRRESELQLQALQQESFVATSSAQLTLLTDLLARWGKERSD